MDERASLRRTYRAARRGLPAATQRRHGQCIRRQFLASPLLWRTRRIAAYLSFDGEPDLRPLLLHLHGLGKILALPVAGTDNGMDFFTYHPAGGLSTNCFGIEEPDAGARWLHVLALDLVLVPLVAFDGLGNRLGMGGGFYDRRFANQPDGLRPLLVGVAHEVQRASVLPAAPWDVTLDAVLTERGWQAFTTRARL